MHLKVLGMQKVLIIHRVSLLAIIVNPNRAMPLACADEFIMVPPKVWFPIVTGGLVSKCYWSFVFQVLLESWFPSVTGGLVSKC